MGARANYVIIEDGKIAIYYAHWGAMSIPAVVMNGPTATSVYIRDMGSTDRLMNDMWAEGGILLDADRRALLFFGGENTMFSPPLQRLLLRVMRREWQGWSVAWAGRGIVDFGTYPGVADSLGINPSTLIMRKERIIEYPYAEATIRDPHENPWVYTVITVTWEDGRVGDYTFDKTLDGYLLFGPHLLDILRERVSDTLPCEEDENGDAPRDGALINTTAQSIWIWRSSPLYSAPLERIEHVWPGWTADEHFEGLGRQVALSGRNPAIVAFSYDQVAKQLLSDLTRDFEDSNQLLPAVEQRRDELIRLLQEAIREETLDWLPLR